MAEAKKVEQKQQQGGAKPAQPAAAGGRFAPTVQKVYKTAGRESKDFRGIIRIAGREVNGHLMVKDALRTLKGIGHNLGKVLTKLLQTELGIEPTELVGNLPEGKLAEIESVIKVPGEKGVFKFMLNRQRDIESGKDVHLLSTDLSFAVKQDFQREREVRSWKGWRRSIGQKVRGQRSRNTGRTGMTVGVLKKAIKAQKAAAATGAQEAGKKEEKK